ncbi:MAG TPA: hypothetical protein VFX89_10310 [Gammaproteobacteria bacterium]|nr:hypothetical protein [Gammaproteobacteria bacterium]
MKILGDVLVGKSVAVCAALVLAGLAAAPAQAQKCDRTCLGGMISTYVDALVARDPAKLPLAANVRYTEDSAELKLGDGVWKTVTGKDTFRQDYLDTAKQIAAAHLVLLEDKNRLLYSVVLYVSDKKITGIETLVQRITSESRFQPTELGKPIRGFNDPVPAGKKESREAMIKTALTYPEGLRIGSFPDATPFAKEAYRVENGVITAGEGCGRQPCGMYTQRVMLHPGIVASVAAVDEDNGTVLLWMNFGYTDSYGPGQALVTFEGFKVWGGEIHSVNAFFRTMPLATPRFWKSSDPVR